MKRVIHLLSCAIILAALIGCRSGSGCFGFGRSNQSNGACCEGGNVMSSDVTYEGGTILGPPPGTTTTILPSP
ncbi:MAG: hypothetical protein ACKVH8_07670 [Pirellulales bacterium]|jgi:hypothetical protein